MVFFKDVALGTVTAPLSGGHSPASTRRSDVFPEPLGPVISRWRPGDTVIETPFTRSLCPPPGSGAPTETFSNAMTF